MGTYEVGREQVPLLVEEMRAGSTRARHKLIEAHVGLAFSEASLFDDDEALAEALLELVTATDDFRASSAPAETYTSYLQVALRRACGRYKRGRGGNRDQRVETVDALDASNHLTRRHHRLRSASSSSRYEEMELVLSVCEDEVEAKIVELRSQGWKDVDIAKQIGTSPSFIPKRTSKMELRLRVQEKLLGEDT